jgi:hypothetical protein
MKPFIRGSILTIVAVSTLFSTVPAGADTTSTRTYAAATAFAHAAPADEYFGPLGLSILGIRNMLVDTTQRLDRAGEDTGTLENVTLLEACVHDWEAKYPADAWLPGTVLALHRAYRKMGSAESVRRSVDTASWLIARYPNSAEARTARAELIEAMTDEGTPSQVDVAKDPPDAPAAPAAPR